MADSISILTEASDDGGLVWYNSGGSAPDFGKNNTIEFRITITNDGTTDLENITFGVNNLLVPLTAEPVVDLAVGESVVLTSDDHPELSTSWSSAGPKYITGSVDGEAVGTANPVSDSDQIEVGIWSESLSFAFEVTADGSTWYAASFEEDAVVVNVGDVVNFRVTVVNDGVFDSDSVYLFSSTLGLSPSVEIDDELEVAESLELTAADIPELAFDTSGESEGILSVYARVSGYWGFETGIDKKAYCYLDLSVGFWNNFHHTIETV